MEFYLIHMQNIRSSKGTIPVNRPAPEWIFSGSRSPEEAKFEDLIELEPDHFDYLFFGISDLLSSKNRKWVPKEKRQPCHQPSYLPFWGMDCIVPVTMFFFFRSIHLYRGKRAWTREKGHFQFLHSIVIPMQHYANGCKICASFM